MRWWLGLVWYTVRGSVRPAWMKRSSVRDAVLANRLRAACRSLGVVALLVLLGSTTAVCTPVVVCWTHVGMAVVCWNHFGIDSLSVLMSLPAAAVAAPPSFVASMAVPTRWTAGSWIFAGSKCLAGCALACV